MEVMLPPELKQKAIDAINACKQVRKYSDPGIFTVIEYLLDTVN